MARKRGLLLTAVVFLAVIVGCTWISVLSGPRTLSVGDTATYVLSLGGDGPNQANGFSVVAEVPDSWSLLSSSYTGTIGGVPVSGLGVVASGDPPWGFPAVRDGFQYFWLGIPEESAKLGDSGEMTLDFDVVDIPEGEFCLKFWFSVYVAAGEGDTSPPTFAEINREPHEYEFADSLDLKSGALLENLAVAVSGDGRSLVLGGRRTGISVVDRDPLTGALSHNHYLLTDIRRHSRDETVLRGIEDLVFAPDDRQVYAVGGRRLVCFQRDIMTGRLSVSQVHEDGVDGVDGLGGARSVTISKDGASVYVAAFDDNAVSVFDRDPWSGDLSFVEAHFHSLGSGGIAGMREPASLAVSPDDAQVYVAGTGNWSGCIVIFDRDPSDGTLTPTPTFCGVGRNGRRPWSLAVAPGGNHVYSVIHDEGNRGWLAVLGRDPQNGRLSLVEVHEEGVDSVTGLINPSDLALSPDGRYVFVSAHGSLVVFSRDPVTGSLSFENADFDPEIGVTGLPVPHQIAFSADGLDLFYGSSGSLAVFSSRPRPLSQWP